MGFLLLQVAQSLGRKIPWRKKWQPTLVFLPGESHGQRTLAGCSPWGRWISRGWTPAGGARDRFFEGKLPKAIRLISPIAPPFSEQLGHQPSCSPTEQFGSSALLLLPWNSLGHQPTVPPPEQSGSSALLFFQCSGRLGPHSGCCGPPCRIDRARGVGSVERVKELERENGF